jgi:hypothetical protein
MDTNYAEVDKKVDDLMGKLTKAETTFNKIPNEL